ncbi:hypothetical protein [Pseudomonas nitroreducens]|uniref:Uncharacterized protein n=1 Tax=Pseudomonas nitroreducens TaxID=46680 RepID=A0A6G6IXY6_PSENT|nr:hypothetical protein [Pseudomonas nitroreducens]QIE88005.1 hypothetical protein G5B91_17680 [Pseudomonas nitroreducens]
MHRKSHWRSLLDWRDPDYEEPLPESIPDDVDDHPAWVDHERFDGPPAYEGTGGECRQWRTA